MVQSIVEQSREHSVLGEEQEFDSSDERWCNYTQTYIIEMEGITGFDL